MYYKVVLNGVANGQDVKNILYYRDGIGFSWVNQLYGGSEVLANNVIQEVVPKMLAVLCDNYSMESVDVYPHNDALQLTVQQPWSAAVNQPGTQTITSHGIATCINIKFQLEPTGLMNGIWPPRRAYIALGPIPNTWVGEDGYVPNSIFTFPAMMECLDALSQDLEFLLPAPGTFYPIRVRHNRAIGSLVKWTSWADVSGCVMNRRGSFRRSRMPES